VKACSERVIAIACKAQPSLVLGGSALLDRLAPQLGEGSPLARAAWLRTDEALGDPVELPPAPDEVPALLQYTSGSTASPRGVVVTRANMLANQRAIRRAFGHDQRSIGVSWLPTYHDMGLIGMLLQPLYVGGSATFMAPLSFLKRPALWLEAISKFGATTSGAPNFGFELCVERISERELDGLDLSSWRVAFCGAEPIRHAVLSAFADKLARCGFDEGALFPCYGLAEATLLVSGARLQPRARSLAIRREALDRGRVELAEPESRDSSCITCCGPVIEDHQLRIVDPETRSVLDQPAVGEIWVAGPSLAAGYHDDPAATAERFAAYTQAGEGPYLRTGDLGFVHDGMLYVSGRQKELLIIRGRNLYPQDIEGTINAVDAELRNSTVAAVGLGEHEHELAVIVELPRRARARQAEITAAIVESVAAVHGVAIARLAIVAPRTLPRTSSGKLQRRLARDRLLAGDYDPVPKPIMQSLYTEPTDYFSKLEARTSNYRFDLERDVAWSQLDAPGLYFTPAVLDPGGVELDALATIDDAADCFQWALAIAICEEFVALEQRILGFLRTEQAAGRLPAARSVELFEDEEVKHVQLFRRYADALAAQRPALASVLNEHLRRSFERAWWHDDRPDKYPSAAVYHFVNWLHFVYFEEYSIHLHAVMRHDPRVQPAWLSAHAAHMREERQHVLTDAAYLDRLDLDQEQRRSWSQWFLEHSANDASGLAGLEGVWTFMCEQFAAVERLGSPIALLGDLDLRRRAFVRLLTREGAFTRTLAAAPGFADFVAALEARPRAVESTCNDEAPSSELELQLQLRLREQIAAALKMDPARVALDQPLIHFGLDSVAAVQIVGEIERFAGAELPPTLLFEQPDVQSLARAIANIIATSGASSGLANLPTLALDDAMFDDDEPGPRTILLTGATGFLCSHLLLALLEGSEDQVICLVRADDEAQARARLHATLDRYRLSCPELDERVEVLVGDVAQPRLGLTPERFKALAREVDVIFHGAAIVDFVRPYPQLEAANVNGTHEIIRLALAGGNVPLNLISTIGIFDTQSQRGDQRIAERDQPDHEAGFRNGYGRSKWAAEQLALQARRRGLPLRIFRPGIVCGSTKTGAWQPDMVAALLKSYVESGVGIRPVADGSLDAAPVDYVARACALIARRPDTLGETFHLINPNPTPWRTIYQALARLGHPVQQVDYADWLASLTRPGADPALLPYAAYFKTRDRAWKLRQPSFDCSNTLAALTGSELRCPVLDERLLALYLEHFRMTGFLRGAQEGARHVG
jgi:thioester reductase-like protein